MPRDPDQPDTRTPIEILRDEAAFTKREAETVAAARLNAADRCPDCGSLGSIEDVGGGVMKCVDCDESVLQARQLGGFGRN